ncbi:single-stranded-DNA-specific exonuclease RecJ [Candidatus Saccharibacteria bacterium]|nr:single-stranded-DNA-specific exonuclease RecJ [Candidatus Saccharibacteria bacterium]
MFSRLLKARGLSEEFLDPKYEELSDPLLLPDMDKAVSRLVQAVSSGEKVLVYGDYDVDGVTAATIMKETLELIGVSSVSVMLPDRFIDGYGMSSRAVERATSEGVSLVVTVDCGSNNGVVVDELSAAGVDVIVTDHHEISDTIPSAAVAVVNPKRKDFTGPKGLRELCGAGVAFFVARALVSRGLIPEGREKWLLDLTMIGTICDSMELTSDNRIICRYGLLVLGKTKRPGLLELMRVAGTKALNTEAIGFQIGPRLNAAGRLETAGKSLDLLSTWSRTEAAELARELNELNKERRRQQQEAVSGVLVSSGAGAGGADGAGTGGTDALSEPVVVVSGPWHEGILGIIAGRLTERLRKPSFVLTEVSDGGFKGSGRSFGEFNLAEALNACRDDLVSGGGHAAAAGVTVKPDRLDDFKRDINDFYKGLGLSDQERFLEVSEDLEVEAISDFSLDFVEELSQLEPFGNGNPEPVFLLPGVTVMEVRKMGADGKHLRLTIRDGLGTIMKLVAFFARGEWFELQPGERADVWVSVMKNEWNGSVSVEGRILRVERSKVD